MKTKQWPELQFKDFSSFNISCIAQEPSVIWAQWKFLSPIFFFFFFLFFVICKEADLVKSKHFKNAFCQIFP